METDTSLVRADSVVELHTVADIVLNLALVVYPAHTECKDAVRLDHALDNTRLFPFGMLVINLFYGQKHFMYSLVVLFLARVTCLESGHDFNDFHDCVF